MVVDADGLNAFQGRSAELSDRRAEAILTPHAGEFGRLTGLSPEEVTEDRVSHARKAASEFRSVVLLKGSRTVVADPDGRATVNPTGGSYLASGGTGDVLTGTIGALLAKGLSPADASIAGAFVHGLAGRLASEDVGEGVVASDLFRTLPKAMALLAEAR
jgi:NAD(P)H-hydrate epimerase